MINLGTVTNTGAGIGMDSVIQIEFEAILIISPDIEYGYNNTFSYIKKTLNIFSFKLIFHKKIIQ